MEKRRFTPTPEIGVVSVDSVPATLPKTWNLIVHVVVSVLSVHTSSANRRHDPLRAPCGHTKRVDTGRTSQTLLLKHCCERTAVKMEGNHGLGGLERFLRPDHRFNPFDPDAGSHLEDTDLDFSKLDFTDPSTISKVFGMPPITEKSPAEVRREARQFSTAIFASYERLRGILARHEATIHKRWAKKKKRQRLETLKSAWGPGMPTAHRPDFVAFRNESKQQPGTSQYRDHYIWPHINQEDLSGPKTLLLLLNARGRHHPSEFAGADFEAMHLGRVSQRVIPMFLNSYIMILHGYKDAHNTASCWPGVSTLTRLTGCAIARSSYRGGPLDPISTEWYPRVPRQVL